MKKTVRSNDPLQKGYTYLLSAKEGEDFDPEFRPYLTPKQMLELGVFGGAYFADASEFPKAWFRNAKLCSTADAAHNFYGVAASQPRSVWEEKGWMHKDDPRGWFQWYCRYYMGRRGEDDARQIKRWKAIRRHASQIQNSCRPGDFFCRPKQRQALLHWAYDSRKL